MLLLRSVLLIHVTLSTPTPVRSFGGSAANARLHSKLTISLPIRRQTLERSHISGHKNKKASSVTLV